MISPGGDMSLRFFCGRGQELSSPFQLKKYTLPIKRHFIHILTYLKQPFQSGHDEAFQSGNNLMYTNINLKLAR